MRQIDQLAQWKKARSPGDLTMTDEDYAEITGDKR